MASTIGRFSPQHQRIAVWQWDDSEGNIINNSRAASSPRGDSFTIFNEVNDYLYLGMEDRFDMVAFLLSDITYLTDIEWEYWDGGPDWCEFTAGIGFLFNDSGAERFDRLNNWQKKLLTSHIVGDNEIDFTSSPDMVLRYWVRAKAIKANEDAVGPSINRIVFRQYAEYATVEDVANILQIKNNFNNNSIPSYNTIEDYIHNAQSQIEYMTRKSWRLHISYEENHDFNRHGFHLVKNYPIEVINVSIWDGAGYETKLQGRQGEFFLVPDTGMVYFARYFLLPARIQAYVGAAWGWGLGEFTFPVQISYFYGSNIYDNEREGGMVNDIAKKLAAIDVIQNYDATVLTVSGADNISLERKSDLWRAEIEQKLESLSSFEIF